MRSIRLSLVVYFLLLEAVALGAASWLVYTTAAKSRRAEQITNGQLVAKVYEDEVEKEKQRFNDELLRKAKKIASVVKSQWQPERLDLQAFFPLGLLSSSIAPQGDLLAVGWTATSPHGPWQLQAQIGRRLANVIVVNEELLLHDADLSDEEFFQVNYDWGLYWKSKSLSDNWLTYEPSHLSGLPINDAEFDDIELPSGEPGRRVQYKTAGPRMRSFFRGGPPFNGPAPAGDDRRGNPPRSGRPSERPPEGPAPFMVVQCACGFDRRDAALQRLNSDLSLRLHELNAESESALRHLRSQLFWIGLLTFAATAIGGSLLVGVGLAPLRRLSDAVSRVSPKDFHLSLGAEALPRELDPIAQRIRATLDELRRAFDREKQAAADISHELRTPVAALLATLDVALRKPRTSEEYRNTIVEARNIGGQMRQLVEKILALARLDADAARVQVGPVDVADLVEQCVSLIRPLAAVQDLKLAVQCQPVLTWTTDGDKLREVLINLLHNAIQYNVAGGSITIRVAEKDGRLELAVCDTGVGIAPEDLPRVFERFYRADPSRQANDLNAGLGLSIVRGYVGLLGGTIDVTSQPGAGATFRVILPATPAGRREAA